MIGETTPFHEAAHTGRLNFLNTGTGTAKIVLYGGTRPANSTSAPGTPIIAAISLANPAGVVTAGTLVLSQLEAALINTTGTVTWARVVNRNGDTAFDMDAGAVGSASECTLSAVQLYAGGLVSLISAILG